MPTATARVGDLVLAEADAWETVEGNVYVRPGKTYRSSSCWRCSIRQFPRSAIKNPNTFLSSDTKTFCPWKGEAEYYSVKSGGMWNGHHNYEYIHAEALF
jgi:hypothetical protein